MRDSSQHCESDAIEIAEDIYWVGCHMGSDMFQCHPYLIKNGDQSVLIDPGSDLTFQETLRKIEEITPFSNIRYFVCQHQDPDITGALRTIDKKVTRDDAVVVTHWRAETLIKHYDLDMPFLRVEDHEWALDLNDRKLEFIFTPYLHFPGAFCTFDKKTGILFSSDLFGGFTEGSQLFADSEAYFESIRPFHEHYMPSREILQFSLTKIQSYPVKMIAPQHGRIIPESLVNFMIENLKALDCGLFTAEHKHIDLNRLSQLNKALRDITNIMILNRDFREIVKALVNIIRRMIPSVFQLEFFTFLESKYVLHFSPESLYKAQVIEEKTEFEQFFTISCDDFKAKFKDSCLKWKLGGGRPALLIPLYCRCREEEEDRAIAILRLAGDIKITYEVEQLISQISKPLQVAMEREIILHFLDQERQKFYENSIRDSLTGLFNRFYMNDVIKRQLTIHNRDDNAGVSVIMFDLDHFKSINDNFGHNAGDEVLRKAAKVLLECSREGDLQVRLGGEEFAIFTMGSTSEALHSLAEKVREQIGELTFDDSMEKEKVTVSAGLAQRFKGEPLDKLIHRADKALYEAKKTGRNKVCVASEAEL